MGPVRIQLNWKQFVFHGGCSFNLKSMSGAGLIAGGREGSGKETYSILHSGNPWDAVSEEEFHDDLTKPRKVHCKTPSRCRLLDPLWEGTSEKHGVLAKRNRMQSSPAALNHQNASN